MAGPVRARPSNPRPRDETSYYTARTMQTTDHIKALEREGQLLVAAAKSAGTTAPVPSCPGWEVRDVLAHIGFVHRWAARYVAEGLTEMVDEPDEATILSAAPPGTSVLSWVAEGHAELVEVLLSAPPDVRSAGPSSPLRPRWRFGRRRQAHETAVHRVDAEQAAGAPSKLFDAAFAVDGADEVLLGFFARPRRRGVLDVRAGTIGLEATDAGTAWSVRIAPEGIKARRGVDDSDLLVRGTASDLYLFLCGTGSSGTATSHERLEMVGREDLLLQLGETTPTSTGVSRRASLPEGAGTTWPTTEPEVGWRTRCPRSPRAGLFPTTKARPGTDAVAEAAHTLRAGGDRTAKRYGRRGCCTERGRFWVALVITGVAAGVFGALTLLLLYTVQHLAFNYSSRYSSNKPSRNPATSVRLAALLVAGAFGGSALVPATPLRRAAPKERNPRWTTPSGGATLAFLSAGAWGPGLSRTSSPPWGRRLAASRRRN